MRILNCILFSLLFTSSVNVFAAWKDLICVDENQFTAQISFDQSKGLVKLADVVVVPAHISNQIITYYWGGQDGSKYFATLNRGSGLLNTRENASGIYVPAFKCEVAKNKF